MLRPFPGNPFTVLEIEDGERDPPGPFDIFVDPRVAAAAPPNHGKKAVKQKAAEQRAVQRATAKRSKKKPQSGAARLSPLATAMVRCAVPFFFPSPSLFTFPNARTDRAGCSGSARQ